MLTMIDCKIKKSISATKKRHDSLSRKSLITIYKAFFRSLIDYGDIIYEQPQNESFCEKLVSIQYKAALVITGAGKVLLVKKPIKSSD